jgi:hypothetical protein
MSKYLPIGLIAAVALTGTYVSARLLPPDQGAKPAPPQAAGPVKPPANDADKIKSAMSAAPAAVSANATIMDMTTMKPLRKGTNGWTCLPDLPHSPGADPMCLDQNGLEWVNALMSKKDPPKGKMGFGYMLMGGSDASNTDPHATQPPPGGKWIDTGPHVMVLNIGESFAGYPTTPANTKAPYVMFPGTPYAHLMIPVK